MDKLTLEYLLLKSNKIKLNNFKEHVILEVFNQYIDSDILNLPNCKIKKIVSDFLSESHQYNTSNKNPLQINYYLVRGWTEIDAKLAISNIQKSNNAKIQRKRKENPENYKKILSPYTVDFWIKKGFSEEESIDKIKECRPNNHNYWIKKGYSISEADAKVSLFQKEMSAKLSTKRLESPMNYDGILTTQTEYWKKRGYSIEESFAIVKERQTTFTLDKCILKHGITKGTIVFNDRQRKWLKSLYANFEKYGDGRSPQSKWVNDIKIILTNSGILIPDKEKWIREKETNGKGYSYDLTVNKKIIEFNGDYWHANPLIYGEDWINKTKKMTASEIWQYDVDKIKLAELHGYKVLTVWESQYNKDPNEVIQRILEFLIN
jgi:hypothetical protein